MQTIQLRGISVTVALAGLVCFAVYVVYVGQVAIETQLPATVSRLSKLEDGTASTLPIYSELTLVKNDRDSLAKTVELLTLQLEQATKDNKLLAADINHRLFDSNTAAIHQPESDSLKNVDVKTSLGKSHKNGHKLGIIVPFRNVTTELMEFVPHMHHFLQKQNINFEIFVLNQTDNWRFNRGHLLNVGFLEAEQADCDYIAMHDVDLLPLNDNLSYRFPTHALHLASPKLHPIYHYSKFIGGVMLVKSDDFRKTNGLSTNYWGWGREDDDFYRRLKKQKIQIERPEEIGVITTGYSSFLHIHDKKERPRDYMQVGRQLVIGKLEDNVTGISTAEHTVVRKTLRFVEGYVFHVVEVDLYCNITVTPWCQWYDKCKPGYYRSDPGQRICTPCVRKCWTGFVLVGECPGEEFGNTNRECKKVGRDISEEDAKLWPAGTLAHNVTAFGS